MLQHRDLIQQLIAVIDRALSRQLNMIIHAPAFQQLEASWRGIQWLLLEVPNDKAIQVKLLNVSYRELSRDILNAIEFDQSLLFNKIYSSEFDQAGGKPFGLLIGDYYFSHRISPQQGDGLSVLSAMSKIAAAAFAPFVSGLHPSFFGLDEFSELKPSLNLNAIFRQQEYNRWQQLRLGDDARFIGLVLPRVLIRKPYNAHGVHLNHRYFTETVSRHSDYLWANACYAYAMVAINAFIETGWFADMRGVNPKTYSGGVVTQLPRDHHAPTPGHTQCKLSTEIAITDQQERALTDQGFLALKDYPQLQLSVFYSSQSIQKPLVYEDAVASANAKISGMLHYLMCAARFAHYVKIIIRDKVGSFISPSNCQEFLQDWIMNYCTRTSSSNNTASAQAPLNEAKVQIHEQMGMPGKYLCTLHLKPHYQLDELQSQLRLVTKITLT